MACGVSDLSRAQREFLRTFFAQPFGTDFCLTGGTALAAFHLGHRVSLDLDLFARRRMPFSRQPGSPSGCATMAG